MDTEKIYYVYVYLDPRYLIKKKWIGYKFNYVPFYIGKGKGGRYLSHIKDFYKLDFDLMTPKEKYNLERKFHKINSIKNKANKEPIIEFVQEGLDEESAFKLEEDLIEAIGRIDYGGTLFNYRSGGYGGGSLSPESRIKVSISLKEYYEENDVWNKGVPMAEEGKCHLRKINTGKKQSTETINRRVKTINKVYEERGDEINQKRKDTIKERGYIRDNEAIGKKISTTKKGNVSIPQSQRDQISETLKRKYASGEIINANTDVCRTDKQIKKQSEKMKGKIPWNKGMKGDYESPLKEIPRTQEVKDKLMKSSGRRVFQFDLQGIFIKEWYSAGEAIRGINCNGVDWCCNGRAKSAGGFIWIWKDKYSDKLLKQKIDNYNIINCNYKSGGEHVNAKKVNQIDINTGKIIKIWDSMTDAKNILGKINIIRAITQNKTAGGFKWSYVDKHKI